MTARFKRNGNLFPREKKLTNNTASRPYCYFCFAMITEVKFISPFVLLRKKTFQQNTLITAPTGHLNYTHIREWPTVK